MPQRQRQEIVTVGEGDRAQRILVHISEPVPEGETILPTSKESTKPLELASPRNARGRKAYAEYLEGFRTSKRK